MYNTSHETIILPKNQIVGRCQLILQPNEGAYLQEMSTMQKEGAAEKEVKERSKKRNGDVDSEETQEELSREWVIENFWLQDNPIIKNNPEVGEELIRVLQKKGRVFEGGAKRDQVIGQGVAGRTDWIVARVELKPGEETPVNMKQRAMNPEDSAQLTAQLKLWEQQDLITPIDSEWNSALLSVAKKNTAAKRFVIDLRPLNAKCKKINLYIGSVEQNLQKLHGI